MIHLGQTRVLRSQTHIRFSSRSPFNAVFYEIKHTHTHLPNKTQELLSLSRSPRLFTRHVNCNSKKEMAGAKYCQNIGCKQTNIA